MKKTTFPMGNDPRTGTKREAKITGIRIDVPQYEGGVPTVVVDYKVSTFDLQGSELLSNQLNSLSMKGNNLMPTGVQKTDERTAIEAEVISALEKTGALEKLVNLDINKFTDNEQQKFS